MNNYTNSSSLECVCIERSVFNLPFHELYKLHGILLERQKITLRNYILNHFPFPLSLNQDIHVDIRNNIKQSIKITLRNNDHYIFLLDFEKMEENRIVSYLKIYHNISSKKFLHFEFHNRSVYFVTCKIDKTIGKQYFVFMLNFLHDILGYNYVESLDGITECLENS